MASQEKFSKIFSRVAQTRATQRLFAPIGERVVTYHWKTMRGLAPRSAGRRDWEKKHPPWGATAKASLVKGRWPSVARSEGLFYFVSIPQSRLSASQPPLHKGAY